MWWSDPLLNWLSRVIRVVVGLVLLTTALAFFAWMASGREQPELKAEVISPLLVRGLVIKPQEVNRIWNGYGTARAMVSADVASEVAARVVERAEWLEPGAEVRAGQVLLRLDRIDFEIAAAGAQQSIESLGAQIEALTIEAASLERQIVLASEETEIARRDAQRARDAIERGAGNLSEIDQWLSSQRRAERSLVALEQQRDLIPSRVRDLEARVESQRATLRQAQENLSRTVITAPIDGVVQEVAVKAGEWTAAGRTALRIVDLRRIEVPVRLAPEAAQTVRPGDIAELRQRAESELSWVGRVSRIAPESDERTRSIVAYVEVQQSEPLILRPGQFVVVSIEEQGSSFRTVVPRRAIRGGRVFVATKSDAPEAAIWPVASRVANAIARRIAGSSLLEQAIEADLDLRLREHARLEVGTRGDEVAQAASQLTRAWLGEGGSESLSRQMTESLATALTPVVARWLLATDPALLPDSIRHDLEVVQRLSVAHMVEVDIDFSVEALFDTLDPIETQWAIVRRRDGESLAGSVLLVSNLEQLVEGSLIEIALPQSEGAR